MSISPDELHRAIGRVVYEWALLEDRIDALVFDLAALFSRVFYEEDGAATAYMLLTSNLDLRANISTAKALALKAAEDMPDLFGRLEPILNTIGNELRNERNRFVHDRWVIWGDKIARVKSGSQISREPASGDLRLEIGTVKEFADLPSIEAVAERIFDQTRLISHFQHEIQDAYRQKFPAIE